MIWLFSVSSRAEDRMLQPMKWRIKSVSSVGTFNFPTVGTYLEEENLLVLIINGKLFGLQMTYTLVINAPKIRKNNM